MTTHGLTRTEEHRSASAEPAVMPAVSSAAAAKAGSTAAAASHVVIDCKIKKLYYGSFLAVRDTDIDVSSHDITAFIGPSGCGKSTVLLPQPEGPMNAVMSFEETLISVSRTARNEP